MLKTQLRGDAVPESESQSGYEMPGVEVLTLAEAASFLRVPEEAVLELVTREALPAQRIGGEWRVLKRALVEWLRFGPHLYHEFRRFPPPWMLDHPFWDDLFHALEKRVLNRILAHEQSSSEGGSKRAVLKHFGIFKDDADLDEQLANLRAGRKAAGG
jgi:excisionase family DNA binding protein